MRIPASSFRFLCVAILANVAACVAPDEPSAPASSFEPEPVRESRGSFESSGGQEGSLSALTSEIRQLRVAVEELARNQTETQALAVYLSAQQSRMAQADEQLADARREIDSLAARRQDIEAQLSSVSEEQSRAVAPTHRAALEEGISGLKYEQGSLDLQLQRARGRENELSRALQLEEDRWNELTSRLEELATK